MAFRAAHVPESTIDMKKEEFNRLKQDNNSVNEYLSQFNKLARYAPKEVDIDKKKIRKFLKGIAVGMRLQLLAHDFPTFQHMINKALLLEDARKEATEEYKKRSYQTSIQMSPNEAMFGRKCRSPLCWNEVGEALVFGPDILKAAEEQVKLIRERLKTAQNRQKNYADNWRRDLEFEKGDHVYLRVSPLRGMRRFGVSGKLAPRYIGPYLITARRGEVAYQFKLPEDLTDVHNVFHMSQLKKCLCVPEEQVLLGNIELEKNLTYKERPIRVLEEVGRQTRRKTIKFYKVQWSNHSEDEATWEREDHLCAEFPELLP
ncbi:uncharacterized protein LOC127785943 [Oryza glaberrima]|uniref:uncharacterized protein LOC127785943 n=1 Tax=Oryza glaberrima TaxID=4538 RepID=UPI00224C276E|nr:uncharacterized protein LOC127785943 [Oryza glaberrima]